MIKTECLSVSDSVLERLSFVGFSVSVTVIVIVNLIIFLVILPFQLQLLLT